MIDIQWAKEVEPYNKYRRFKIYYQRNGQDQNAAAWNNVLSNVTSYYYNTSGNPIVSSNTYGIYCGQVTPTVSSSTSNTPILRFPNPAVRYRSTSTIMDTTAWQNVDASATNIKIRNEVYAIDIPGASDVVAKLCKDSALSGDFTDNLIYLGDL